MKILYFNLIVLILAFCFSFPVFAVDTGQSGSRSFRIALSELNTKCDLHLNNQMKLSDIFSARLPDNAMKAYIKNDIFVVEVPNIKNLVHKEVDDEATFAGKVLDMDPAKNNGKGVTLFRTFYRDSDDSFYLRCQPKPGKVFGDTFKINADSSLTKIQ